jgi:LmbE family N-acetylglucosaminyl deacetylase
LNDRHIDHGNGAQLTIEAAFLSGLAKVETVFEDKIQDNWRPRFILHYIQDYYMQPTIVVDIKEHYQKKMDAVLAYSSQFFNPNSHEPETPISSEEFLLFLDARMREMGRWVGSKYGEGFISKTPISVLELSKYFPV